METIRHAHKDEDNVIKIEASCLVSAIWPMVLSQRSLAKMLKECSRIIPGWLPAASLVVTADIAYSLLLYIFVALH